MPSILLFPLALTVAAADSAPVRIELQHPNGIIFAGEQLRARVILGQDGYLTVLRIHADGQLGVLFPSRPSVHAFVTAGSTLDLRSGGSLGRYARWESAGGGFVMAVLSPRRLDFTPLVDRPSADRWGTHTLGRAYYTEADLHALAERLAGGRDYEFDIARYGVRQALGRLRPYQASCAYQSRLGYGYGLFGVGYGPYAGFWGTSRLAAMFWQLDAPLFDPFYDPYAFGLSYAGLGYRYDPYCDPWNWYVDPTRVAGMPFEPREPEETWSRRWRARSVIGLRQQIDTAGKGPGASEALTRLRPPKPVAAVEHERRPQDDAARGSDRRRSPEVSRPQRPQADRPRDDPPRPVEPPAPPPRPDPPPPPPPEQRDPPPAPPRPEKPPA